METHSLWVQDKALQSLKVVTANLSRLSAKRMDAADGTGASASHKDKVRIVEATTFANTGD